MSQQLHNRTRVYGIDFSGARDAGKKIWIASGTIEESTLQIDECYQARDLPGSAKALEPSLNALRAFIAKEKTGVFGLDFPFGLPQALVAGKKSWEDFALSFPNDYSSINEFRQHCRQAGGSRELKRRTDIENKTPFSPYNLRLYRQTYHGIRELLHPLVQNRAIRVLPMQNALPDKPWLLEICPASTLKQEDLPSRRYKSRSDEWWRNRRYILEKIEEKGVLSIPSGVRTKVLDDRHGDALDSVIAAFVTFRAIRDPAFLAIEDSQVYALEGYVYV